MRTLLMLFWLLCIPALARDTGTDPSMVLEKYVQHFTVNPDGSYVLEIDNVKTIVQPRAIANHGQYYISYNSSLEQVEKVEAWTHKRDGRHIAVPPDQIKDQQEAASTDAPMFQDTRVKVVVFPDVETGDRLAVHYVIKRHTPLFPGQFEDLSSSPFFENKQFQLIYDMPESMPLRADAQGFERIASASAPGRRRYMWQYAGGDNQRIESESVSYLDYGKRLAVSTFADYAAFARAYEERARQQRTPDAAIRALAEQISGALPAPRAKALALSDWVRKHIRYVGVYIGAGGVVPHAASEVLAQRYGDCKDHAILLEAMLAAVGIDSTAALLNNSNAYRLPSAPTLGVLNHVITYVPSLELYLDSTADSIAAGYLPSSDLGKPVVLTRSGVLARTPFQQIEKNRTVASFGVRKDGRSDFTIARISGGAIAEPFRQAIRDTKLADRELFVQRMLQNIGQQGHGSFDAGNIAGTGDEYRMRFSGVSENFAALPGPTGLATSFNFWGGMGETLSSLTQEKERQQDFVCPPLDNEDELDIRFEPGVRILAVPKPMRLYDKNFSYRASYKRNGNKVLITRHMRFRHDSLICTPADYRRMHLVLERMLRDLKSQIIVQAG